MNAKAMTRTAILSRLSNYAASSLTRGESARADVLALAHGVNAKAFAPIIEAIGSMRLGHVMPTVDRDAVIMAWVDAGIAGKDIAAALGVVPSTVTVTKKAAADKAAADLNSNSDESGEGTEPTAEEIAKADADKRVKRLTSLLASLRKITDEIDNASDDEITLLDQISGAALKITSQFV